MKAIIKGKRYDTTKAVEVSSTSFGEISDHHHFCESLYRTAKGAWFLAGKGGPRSKYAIFLGQGSWSGGEKIDPLTDDEAMRWLEDAGDESAIEAFFPVEDA